MQTAAAWYVRQLFLFDDRKRSKDRGTSVMTKRKGVILLLALLMLALFSFMLISTGIPHIIVQEIAQSQQRSAIREKGQPIAEAYLSEHYSAYSLESVKNNFSAMSHGQPNRYVLAQYTADSVSGTLLIDTSSGKIWDSTDSGRLHEELTAFLEAELALPKGYRLEVGWQILNYDDEANGGAFEEKGYYFVPDDCKTAEDLMDKVMLTMAIKYLPSTEPPAADVQEKAQALLNKYPDCHATIWMICMESAEFEELYEGTLLYKGYGCGYYQSVGTISDHTL